MIEVLEIQVNFAQDLIKSEEQINMIVQFLSNSKNLPEFKKSQLLFECANVLIEEEKSKWRNKIIDLLEESTKLYVFEKQLEVLGNMYLKVS
jgi:tellurite resistance protein